MGYWIFFLMVCMVVVFNSLLCSVLICVRLVFCYLLSVFSSVLKLILLIW